MYYDWPAGWLAGAWLAVCRGCVMWLVAGVAVCGCVADHRCVGGRMVGDVCVMAC